MATEQIQLRRGTTAEHAAFVGAAGEVTVDLTKKTAVVHDGATVGGNPLAREDHSHKSLRGAIYGLVLANSATTPTSEIVCGPGMARDTTNTVDLELTAGFAKRINANWSAGSGNGGLDTGAAANATYYHVFVIRNPSTGAIDLLLSASPTSPVIPVGWTQKRRVGMFLYFGSAIVAGLWRADGSFEFKTPNQVATNLALNGNVLHTVVNPPGIKVRWKGVLLGYHASSTGFWLVARDPDLGPLPADADPALATMGAFYKPGGVTTAAVPFEAWTDTSGRLYLASSPASASNLANVFTHGFFDPRNEFI